jgi:hypothetical protein
MGLAFSYADLNTGCDPFGVGNARSPLTPFGLYAVTPLGVITHVDPGLTPKGSQHVEWGCDHGVTTPKGSQPVFCQIFPDTNG